MEMRQMSLTNTLKENGKNYTKENQKAALWFVNIMDLIFSLIYSYAAVRV